MKSSDNLFILIKSLTKSEKRYFKRFCTIYSKEKKNNYLRLFNAIVRQIEYDEHKIKSQFSNEKFVKQLNVLKNYLYKLIVRALRQFHSAKDKDMILKDLVSHSNILYKKRLYDESYRMIISAKKTAQNGQNLFVLAELAALEKKLVSELKINQSEKLLNKITNEEDVIIANILLYQNYSKILNILNSEFKSYMFSSLNEYSLKNIEKISQDELLIKEPVTNSEDIKQLFYICRFMLGILQNSKENMQLSFDKIICCFTEYKSLINKLSVDNWSCLFNIIIYYIRNGEFNEAENKLTIIKKNLLIKLKEDSVSSLFSLEIYSNIYDLVVSISVADINKSSMLIESINKHFTSETGIYHDQKQCIAYYFIALYYFIIEKYELSLDYLIRFTKEYDIAGISNIEYMVKILYVLNKYELGELDHLEYYISNNLRILRSNEKCKKENLNFFKTFLKIIKAKTNIESNDLLKYLKQCVSLVSKDNEFSNSHQYLDIRIWIDSKLFNKKFIDILQQKYIK